MLNITINPPTGYAAPDGPRPFVEYPKFVHFKGKPSVIVNDAEEEKAVLAGEVVEQAAPVVSGNALMPEPVIPVLAGPNNEREMLVKILEARGVKVDGRWRLPKLRNMAEKISE